VPRSSASPEDSDSEKSAGSEESDKTESAPSDDAEHGVIKVDPRLMGYGALEGGEDAAEEAE
jgi:hypothetical protein